MRRDIGFNQFGDIVVITDNHREDVMYGIVLLTHSQMREAEKHGWIEVAPHPEEINLGLTRARRERRPS